MYISLVTFYKCYYWCSLKQVHELPPEKLKQREVQVIDIGNDSVSSSDYKEDEDPKKFKSQKSGRGPLCGNWIGTVQLILIDKI